MAASVAIQTIDVAGFTTLGATIGSAGVWTAIIGAVGGALVGAIFAYYSDLSIHCMVLQMQQQRDAMVTSGIPNGTGNMA